MKRQYYCLFIIKHRRGGRRGRGRGPQLLAGPGTNQFGDEHQPGACRPAASRGTKKRDNESVGKIWDRDVDGNLHSEIFFGKIWDRDVDGNLHSEIREIPAGGNGTRTAAAVGTLNDGRADGEEGGLGVDGSDEEKGQGSVGRHAVLSHEVFCSKQAGETVEKSRHGISRQQLSTIIATVAESVVQFVPGLTTVLGKLLYWGFGKMQLEELIDPALNVIVDVLRFKVLNPLFERALKYLSHEAAEVIHHKLTNMANELADYVTKKGEGWWNALSHSHKEEKPEGEKKPTQTQTLEQLVSNQLAKDEREETQTDATAAATEIKNGIAAHLQQRKVSLDEQHYTSTAAQASPSDTLAIQTSDVVQTVRDVISTKGEQISEWWTGVVHSVQDWHHNVEGGLVIPSLDAITKEFQKIWFGIVHKLFNSVFVHKAVEFFCLLLCNSLVIRVVARLGDVLYLVLDPVFKLSPGVAGLPLQLFVQTFLVGVVPILSQKLSSFFKKKMTGFVAKAFDLPKAEEDSTPEALDDYEMLQRQRKRANKAHKSHVEHADWHRKEKSSALQRWAQPLDGDSAEPLLGGGRLLDSENTTSRSAPYAYTARVSRLLAEFARRRNRQRAGERARILGQSKARHLRAATDATTMEVAGRSSFMELSSANAGIQTRTLPATNTREFRLRIMSGIKVAVDSQLKSLLHNGLTALFHVFHDKSKPTAHGNAGEALQVAADSVAKVIQDVKEGSTAGAASETQKILDEEQIKTGDVGDPAARLAVGIAEQMSANGQDPIVARTGGANAAAGSNLEIRLLEDKVDRRALVPAGRSGKQRPPGGWSALERPQQGFAPPLVAARSGQMKFSATTGDADELRPVAAHDSSHVHDTQHQRSLRQVSRQRIDEGIATPPFVSSSPSTPSQKLRPQKPAAVPRKLSFLEFFAPKFHKQSQGAACSSAQQRAPVGSGFTSSADGSSSVRVSPSQPPKLLSIEELYFEMFPAPGGETESTQQAHATADAWGQAEDENTQHSNALQAHEELHPGRDIIPQSRFSFLQMKRRTMLSETQARSVLHEMGVEFRRALGNMGSVVETMKEAAKTMVLGTGVDVLENLAESNVGHVLDLLAENIATPLASVVTTFPGFNVLPLSAFRLVFSYIFKTILKMDVVLQPLLQGLRGVVIEMAGTLLGELPFDNVLKNGNFIGSLATWFKDHLVAGSRWYRDEQRAAKVDASASSAEHKDDSTDAEEDKGHNEGHGGSKGHAGRHGGRQARVGASGFLESGGNAAAYREARGRRSPATAETDPHHQPRAARPPTSRTGQRAAGSVKLTANGPRKKLRHGSGFSTAERTRADADVGSRLKLVPELEAPAQARDASGTTVVQLADGGATHSAESGAGVLSQVVEKVKSISENVVQAIKNIAKKLSKGAAQVWSWIQVFLTSSVTEGLLLMLASAVGGVLSQVVVLIPFIRQTPIPAIFSSAIAPALVTLFHLPVFPPGELGGAVKECGEKICSLRDWVQVQVVNTVHTVAKKVQQLVSGAVTNFGQHVQAELQTGQKHVQQKIAATGIAFQNQLHQHLPSSGGGQGAQHKKHQGTTSKDGRHHSGQHPEEKKPKPP
ncbi:unnamed protein product [Amoebophrya sp. A120]|nr:unnamed protein product [Amoebophrya sp. A120]|eukprot:GSA120T00011066001.1